MRSLVMGFAAVIASAMPSLAADVEEANLEARWSGLYAGVLGGYFASTLGQSGCVGFCPVGPRYDSWGLGVQAGYDHQFSNNVVLGGYARFMLASKNASVPIFAPGSGVPLAGGTFTVDPRFAASVGARLGYATGRFMPYIAVGYTVARVTATNPVFAVTDTNTHHGVHGSLGLETLITDHLSADLRYTYTGFGAQSYNFGGGATNYSARASNFTLAINYRF